MVKISKITQSSVYFYFYHEYSLSTILPCKTGDPEGLKPLVGIGKTSTGKISLGTGKKTHLSQTKTKPRVLVLCSESPREAQPRHVCIPGGGEGTASHTL